MSDSKERPAGNHPARHFLTPEEFIEIFGTPTLRHARIHPRGFAPQDAVARIPTDYLHRQVLAPPGRNMFARFASASDLLLLGYAQEEVDKMVVYWAGRISRYKVSGHRTIADDHPAARDGRSLHHHKGVQPVTAETEIISSANSNTKIGRYMVDPEKRAWAEIFTVTWEERRTCPRSCTHWLDCYTNNTPRMRRKDYDLAREEEILSLMEAQLVQHLERIRTPYMYVRLHQAGDFPTLRYVEWWEEMLTKYPRVHVFGYTHRATDKDDDASRAIARAIQRLNDTWWHTRWRIFQSSSGLPARGANTFHTAEQARSGHHMPCPEQVGRVPTCGECQMCFPGDHSRGKAFGGSIGFLQHAKPTDQLPLMPHEALPMQVKPYRKKAPAPALAEEEAPASPLFGGELPIARKPPKT